MRFARFAAVLLVSVLCLSACARRFGELHVAPALVVFTSETAPLRFNLISLEENQSLLGGGTAAIARKSHPQFETALASKPVYQTSPNRHRLNQGRVVVIVHCNDFYNRVQLTLRGDMRAALSCDP